MYFFCIFGFVWKLWNISIWWLKLVSWFILIFVISISGFIKVSIILVNIIWSFVRIVLWSIIWVISVLLIWIVSISIIGTVSWAIFRVVCISRVWTWAVSVLVLIDTSNGVWSKKKFALLFVLTICSSISILLSVLWILSIWQSSARIFRIGELWSVFAIASWFVCFSELFLLWIFLHSKFCSFSMYW